MTQRLKFGNRVWLLMLLLVWVANPPNVTGQEEQEPDAPGSSAGKNYLINSSFEVLESEGNLPKGWNAGAQDTTEAVDGKASLVMDTRERDTSQVTFSAMSQSVDPQPLRGKRVRFSASVKTADRSEIAQAMLWLRVDRRKKNGETEPGAFDNMQDRPIKKDEWGRYEIVLDVDEDAVAILAGLIVLDKARAWIDDARLEVVGDSVKTTQVVRIDSPQTPFYSRWMWAAALGLSLMLLSQRSNHWAQRFALRFTLVYWVLYSFHSLIIEVLSQIVTSFGFLGLPVERAQGVVGFCSERVVLVTTRVVNFVAQSLLGINTPTLAPTGSGDTAYQWVRVLACFLLALLVASIWSLIRRGDHDLIRMRDALRVWLRYTLALTLLSYGLHKAGFIVTQFVMPGGMHDSLMDRTYGESSPMGLLWTFMGVSSMYTFAAGVLEIIPAVLLVFRRTATLGALLAIGVMSNVVLLNLCYDVPVKQYSLHLLVMAGLILSPELPRILSVLVWNRPTEPSNRVNQVWFESQTGIWCYRVLKTFLITILIIVPIGSHVYREVTHQHPEVNESKYPLLNRGFRWVSEFPYNR